jgi:outer membrane protein OmpA-like peptidoglycan-associated protein
VAAATPPPPSIPTPAAPATSVPSGQNSSLTKLLYIFLGLIALGLILGMATCFYVAYRVKRKAEEVVSSARQEMKQAGGLGGMANVGQPAPKACPALDPAQVEANKKSDAAATIPLKQGLTLARVWTTKQGDVESLLQLSQMDADSVTMNGSAPRPNASNATGTRTVCRTAMLNASKYMTVYGSTASRLVTDVSMFTMPLNVYNSLKSNQPAELAYVDVEDRGMGRQLETVRQGGTLTRVEAGQVPFTAIVNGQQVSLPAIHGRGKFGDQTTDIYFLDDPNIPLTLDFHMNEEKFELKVVKISFPVESKMEQQLKDTGKVEVYGIYFDTASATIRPESEPVLKEIADVMKKNPDWKLRVDGHTDNIGGDASNLVLSNKRAAAVKQALVERYEIEGARLTTAGYGASRPKATNDTIEGRALNRRVELVRE